MSAPATTGDTPFHGLLAGSARCIAVTADPQLAGYLAHVCGPRGLILTPPDQVERIRGTGAAVQPFEGARQLSRTDTDLLVLDDIGRPPGLRFHDISRAAHLAVIRRGALPVTRRVRRDQLRGRLSPLGTDVLPVAGRPATVQLYAVRTRPDTGARRWFSPVLGVDGLLRLLIDADVRHVVLRWYEQLPDLPPGEDLDLLVHDRDLPVVEEILRERPGTLPCDLYSVSGLPRSDFHGMSYLPPRLASETLRHAATQDAGYRVPDPEHALLTLAYHAAYHKGRASGLPRDKDGDVTADHDHDYAAALEATARSAGVEIEPTLTGLDRYLAGRNLRPSPDTLRRLSVFNPWAGELAAARAATHAPPGLAVFFVRERAAEGDLLCTVVSRIVEEGFTLLDCRPLDEVTRARVREAVRGGNWGRGPYPASGGLPALAIVAVDAMPRPPDARTRQKWPALDNQRLLVKEEIRERVNQGLPEQERCNVLHSSDNAAEAAEYLASLGGDSEPLLAEADRIARQFAPRADVVRDLTMNGRRARVELIRATDGHAVRKTFRPGCERFAAREELVMYRCPEHPNLLRMSSFDALSVTTDYREDTLHFDQFRPKLLPLPVVHAAFRTARYLHDHDLALIDFTPSNLIVERDGKTTLVDYEFAYEYLGDKPPFESGYDLAGPPAGFAADLPVNPRGLGYARAWQPYVGLTLDQLLHRPRWVQRLLRARYQVGHVLPERLSLWVGLTRRRADRRTRGVAAAARTLRRRRAMNR